MIGPHCGIADIYQATAHHSAKHRPQHREHRQRSAHLTAVGIVSVVVDPGIETAVISHGSEKAHHRVREHH